MYICNDQSGGQACSADSWAGSPVYGRRYRFRIQYNELGTGKWDYSIKDLTTGVLKRTSITSTWHNGTGAWWGAENHDHGSTLGPVDPGNGTNMISMYWMQYFRPSIGTWQVVTDIYATSSLVKTTGSPAYYHGVAYDANYNDDAVNISTVLH